MRRRPVNRRSFLAQVAGGAALSAWLALAARDAGALQVTDCDRGPGADPVGRGSGRNPRTGLTDSDSGAGADPGGCGRGTAGSGVTDSDTGAGADPVGRGRGRESCAEMRGRISALEEESRFMLNDETLAYLRDRLQQHDQLEATYRRTFDNRRALEIRGEMDANIQLMRRIAGGEGKATVDRARELVRTNERNRDRFAEILRQLDPLRRRAEAAGCY